MPALTVVAPSLRLGATVSTRSLPLADWLVAGATAAWPPAAHRNFRADPDVSSIRNWKHQVTRIIPCEWPFSKRETIGAMQLRFILTVCLSVTCVPAAYSQARWKDKASININDCTFVRDPTALRDCLDLIEGQRLGPTITRSPPDPIVSPQLLEEAGADPRSRRGDDSVRRPALRPVSVDPVRVEQVKPRRRSDGPQ